MTHFNTQLAVYEGFKKNSKRTEAEWQLRTLIRKELDWTEWSYQHRILRYTADFAHLPTKLVIEVDGSSHDHRKEYDAKRTENLNHEGWTVIRFTNVQIYKEPEKVMNKIKETLGASVESP